MDGLEAIFRWLHVFAGIIWIGHLYFFNWVNGPLQAKLDGPTKKALVPELMPRALYWFRWGAAYTWVTGFVLLAIVYYMGGVLVRDDAGLPNGAGHGISVGILVIGWVVYDLLWKSGLAKNEKAGAAVSFVLTAAAFGLSQVFVGRAVFIHIG